MIRVQEKIFRLVKQKKKKYRKRTKEASGIQREDFIPWTEVPIGLNIDLNIFTLMKVLYINVKTALYSKEDTTQQASHAYTCYNKTTKSHKENLPKARRGSTHTIFKRSSADFSRVFNEVVGTRRK